MARFLQNLQIVSPVYKFSFIPIRVGVIDYFRRYLKGGTKRNEDFNQENESDQIKSLIIKGIL